jgi:hypothetical protein
MGKIGLSTGIVVAIALILVNLSSCRGTKLTIVADQPTKVYKQYPGSGPPHQDQVVTILNTGESADVIDEEFSKDYMFYKIRLKDGRIGYLWLGDGFRVVPKNSNM